MIQNKLQTTFDHIIFGSYNLEDGVNFIYEKLGVRPAQGGQHLTMGTHNKLINLNNSTYLEVIAIDPNLPKPQRPRWFNMDKFQPDSEPELLTWVVKTNDIKQATSNSKLQHGKIESLQRGIYLWQIAVPENGEMPMQGIAPTIIQWQCEAHPANILQDSGITLTSIKLTHPNADELNTWFKEIGYNKASPAITVAKNNSKTLSATFECSKGTVVFESAF